MHHPIEHDDPLEEPLDRAANYLRDAQTLAVLTGAGISAESGIPTFRASDGLWENHPIEEVATPEGFERDPRLVWRFYNARRASVAQAQPNPGHRALVALEQRYQDGFTLITQNVDGLHTLAGNRSVLELHGSLRRTRCTVCGDIADRGLEPLDELPHCPKCSGLLRPDIVWFHEMLPQDVWLSAVEAVYRCQVFFVIGTSAVVCPAAGLVPLARRNGARVVEFNLTRTEASRYCDVGLYGPAGEMLPKLLSRL